MVKYTNIRLLKPENPVKTTKSFFGKESGILDWNNIQYPQVYDIYKILRANYWIPEEITLKSDVNEWEVVCKNEEYKKAYLRSIGLLQTLDSSQSTFLYGLSRLITDKSLENTLINIANMEVIHNEDYTFLLGSITSTEDHNKILEDTKADKLVQKRNKVVFDLYEEVLNDMDNATPEMIAKALIGNAILEGINFTATFAFFYSLHHYKKLMGGTANHIQYINRD